VPGAAAGNEPADGLGDGAGPAPGVVALGVVVPGVAAPGVAALGVAALGVAALGVLLEVVTPGVPLGEVAGVAGPVPPGDNVGGVDGEPAEQADTGAAASMATAAPPRTVPRKRRRP
jgi:hypothetical protein